MSEPKQVTIYTDGACLGNPGPGGYGALLMYNGHRKELSGGFRRTTNNRMELLAAIVALEALREPCQVMLYSDSQYVVNGMTKGWARKWETRGWKRTPSEPASNPDLWTRLLRLSERYEVRFQWVRGHAGNVENERVDRLAMQAALRPDLPRDEEYEGGPARGGRR